MSQRLQKFSFDAQDDAYFHLLGDGGCNINVLTEMVRLGDGDPLLEVLPALRYGLREFLFPACDLRRANGRLAARLVCCAHACEHGV